MLFEQGLEAFLVTAVALGPVALALRHFGILDHPTERSLHERPTPRGAGIAIGAGALLALVVNDGIHGSLRVGLLIAAGGFGLIGVAEDLRGISPLGRLVGQFVVALVAVRWLLDGLDEGAMLSGLIGCAVVVWLVGFVNAFNFMDGINGIAIAQGLVAGVAWSIIAASQDVRSIASGGVIIAAAVLAFSPMNVPSARAFLGDAGSYFIGAWLAVVVVLGIRAGLPPEAMVAPIVIGGADAFVTLLRRAMRGARLFEPHREHAYQQLVEIGWPQTTVATSVAGLAILCSLLGSVSVLGGAGARVAADIAIVAVVGCYLMTPRVLRLRS